MFFHVTNIIFHCSNMVCNYNFIIISFFLHYYGLDYCIIYYTIYIDIINKNIIYRKTKFTFYSEIKKKTTRDLTNYVVNETWQQCEKVVHRFQRGKIQNRVRFFDFLKLQVIFIGTIVRFGHKMTTTKIFNTNTFVLINCMNNISEIRCTITHNNLYRELISHSCQRYCGVSLNLNRMYIFLTMRNFWHSN